MHIQDTGKYYQCSDCGLHYEEKEQAAACELWCREHGSCNLEITSRSVEREGEKKDI